MKYRNYYILFLFLFSTIFSGNAGNLGFESVEKHTFLPAKNLENLNNAFCSLVFIIGEGMIQSSIQVNQYTRFNPRTNKTSEKHFFSDSFSSSILQYIFNPFFVKDNPSLFLNLSLPFYISYRKLII